MRSPEGRTALPPAPGVVKRWEENVRTLSSLGLLSIDTDTKLLGIRWVDGTHYPIPTPAMIEERMRKDPVLAEKMAQGFDVKNFILTPFALPLDTLVAALGKATLAQYKKGGNKLTSTNGDTLELNEDEPLWAWDQYKGADVNGSLIYHPQRFTKDNHGGSTKAELLKNPENAWRILLLEENPDIPREGKGKTTGGRKQIEANSTAAEYLSALQTDPIYRREQGLTPEDEIVHALIHLTEQQHIINDYQGPGTIPFLTGAYFPASGDVPCLYWDRDNRQWYLGRGDPQDRGGNCGFRPGVGVSA